MKEISGGPYMPVDSEWRTTCFATGDALREWLNGKHYLISPDGVAHVHIIYRPQRSITTANVMFEGYDVFFLAPKD